MALQSTNLYFFTNTLFFNFHTIVSWNFHKYLVKSECSSRKNFNPFAKVVVSQALQNQVETWSSQRIRPWGAFTNYVDKERWVSVCFKGRIGCPNRIRICRKWGGYLVRVEIVNEGGYLGLRWSTTCQRSLWTPP